MYLPFYEHLFPQHDWLFSKYFKSIKLENLNEYLLDEFPNSIIPDKTKFPHHRSPHSLQNEINPKSKNQIYELYRDDFAKFNYEK